MSLPHDPRPTNADEPRPESRPETRDSAATEADGDGVAAGDRLRLREEIARGGMGAVLKAHDADIGRDVAVKVLLADADSQPHLARRFLEEARITGRLQHPGVVPVYALGSLPDGRPYFAMKLVKGRTLADLLAGRADPSADRTRLLHVFEQVCQTLAYAHAHSVIHRDLKPANVMVGAYGEVQVMDWGLAKVLAEGAADGAPVLEATEVASLIRTPRGAEQAARTALLRQSAESALEEARKLALKDKWPEARAVLQPMHGQLNVAGLEDLRRRVEQAEADAALVERLEGIRLKHSLTVKGRLDLWDTDEDYAAAFREAGLVKEGEDAGAAATRIRNSPLNDLLAATLDVWAATTHDPKRRAWLLEMARRADPDPWRDRFRDPAGWQDQDRLDALQKELLSDKLLLSRQKPQSLAAFGMLLSSTNTDVAPLLLAAQARYPDDFWLNFNLGLVLAFGEKWDKAAGFFRAAVAIRPSAALPHFDLGVVLLRGGQLDEASEEFRRINEIDAENADAHTLLGLALGRKGQTDDAIVELRLAIAINPKAKAAHAELGRNLTIKGQLDEAIRECRRATELDPEDAEAFRILGFALIQQGRFTDGRDSTRRCLDLLGPDDPQRPTAAAQLHGCETLLTLEAKLDPVLQGRQQPADDAERLGLAMVCGCQRRYAAAARFCRDALAHDSKLANDLASDNRYNAACWAARAGCGQGEDAQALDDQARAGWRKQALDWLRADLTLQAGQVNSIFPWVRQSGLDALRHWRQDADLSGIRDAAELAKLPADEQEACKKLWADVQALLDKAEPKK